MSIRNCNNNNNSRDNKIPLMISRNFQSNRIKFVQTLCFLACMTKSKLRFRPILTLIFKRLLM